MLRAAKFAKKAHGDQKRAGGAPYFSHPKGVARILWSQGYRQLHLIRAAYLHDVLEDTDSCGIALEDLYGMFGFDTMSLVSAVTRRDGETYREHLERAKAAGPLAIALKRADRTHNNADLVNAPQDLVKLRQKAADKSALLEEVFRDST